MLSLIDLREALLALRLREATLKHSIELLQGFGLTPDEVASRSAGAVSELERVREVIHHFEAEVVKEYCGG